MIKIAPIHNFSNKLRQQHVFQDVVHFLRVCEKSDDTTSYSFNDFLAGQRMGFTTPLSINLDLTVSCNYRCPHCIDKRIINTMGFFKFDELITSLTILRIGGLRSVILIGGGEPTLHPKFNEVIHAIKLLGLQCALVSNGSQIQRVLDVTKYFTKGDWIRYSLDAGSNRVFQHLHRPVRPITLDEICAGGKFIKQRNPNVQLGFSFIVMTPESIADNPDLIENYREMEKATILAKSNNFDYISFKPYVTRDYDGKEVVPHHQSEYSMKGIQEQLDRSLRHVDDQFQVLVSTNLLHMCDQKKLKESQLQPRRCYMQALRQVVTPMGIYACPAYRGDTKSYLADHHGYSSVDNFIRTQQKTLEQIRNFDASSECGNIICIYNSTNWWLDSIVDNFIPISEMETTNAERGVFL